MLIVKYELAIMNNRIWLDHDTGMLKITEYQNPCKNLEIVEILKMDQMPQFL